MESSLVRLRELNDKMDRTLPPEAMLRMLLEMVIDGYAVVGRDSNFQMVSSGFAITFGYSVDELLGKSVQSLLPDRMKPIHHRLMEEWWGRPRSIQMRGRGPITAVTKQGDEFELKASLTPIPLSETVLIGVQRIDAERNL